MERYTAHFRGAGGAEWSHAEDPYPWAGDYPWESRDRAAATLLHVIAGAVDAGATLVRIDTPGYSGAVAS